MGEYLKGITVTCHLVYIISKQNMSPDCSIQGFIHRTTVLLSKTCCVCPTPFVLASLATAQAHLLTDTNTEIRQVLGLIFPLKGFLNSYQCQHLIGIWIAGIGHSLMVRQPTERYLYLLHAGHVVTSSPLSKHAACSPSAWLESIKWCGKRLGCLFHTLLIHCQMRFGTNLRV